MSQENIQDKSPKLAVWVGEMPESNGKTNYTAQLYRHGGCTFEDGICIARSEYPDRVRYEADTFRWIIGELDEKPCILDYDPNRHSGYVAPMVETPLEKKLKQALRDARNAIQNISEYDAINIINNALEE